MRILIADDHETVRKGVCTILTSHKDIEVCGEAANGEEAVQKSIELKPDLIIMDISMPVLSGFDAAKQIKKLLPNTPILILTMHEGRTLADDAKRAGAQGCVSKSDAGPVLLQAVDALLRGNTFFSCQPKFVS